MTSKFSHQNILQPKRLNSSGDLKKIQKGGEGIGRTRLHLGNSGSGATLTLNGVTIGLPSNIHHLSASNCSNSSNNNNSNSNNNNSGINSNNATPAKKGPSIMAKRNARERNRVKQVNQGFQTLRNHIPEGYRMKKMSKVDTLRCALDYIRSMEQILDMTSTSFPPDQNMSQSQIGGGEQEQDESSPQYHGYSSEDINQHLDKICSAEETSLDHSFSSFSDNDDGVSSGDSQQQQQLVSPTFHHHQHQNQTYTSRPLSLQRQHSHHSIHGHNNSTSKSSTIVSMVDENNSDLSGARLENLVKSNNNHNHNTASGSILLPLQQQQQQQQQPDENFRPSPTPTPFIRVVEIIQL